MFKVAYVFMILVPSYGKYEVIAAEPRQTFRQCMVEAQQYNGAINSKSFAVCMPTIHENLTHTLPRETRRHTSR